MIDEPRVCAKYVEWLPYFTPKEHIEMVRSDELAKANEERRKSDEAFREEIRKADRVRDDGFKREEMAFKASERRERRYQWFFTVGSTVAFALAGLAWGNAIFKQQEQPTPPTIINQITTAPPTVVNIITPPTVSTK